MSLSLLLFAAAPGLARGAAEIVHNPVLAAAAGQDIDVSAALLGADKDSRIRLYYRVKGKEQYASLEMTGSPSDMRGTIPGKSVEGSGLEYYLEAYASGSKTPIASSPASSPKVSPHFVTVRQDDKGPMLEVLSPQDGSELDSSIPVITVAWSDPDSGVDLNSAIVKIDGEAVKDKGNIQAFDTLMSYVPSAELGQGRHEIVVVVRDRSGNAGSVKWSFSIHSQFGQKNALKGGFKWEGSLGYETLYGASLKEPDNRAALTLPYRPYGTNRGKVDVTGRGAENTVNVKAFVTDEDRYEQQTLNRYLATLKNDEGLLAVGDYSPNFSDLSLNYLPNLRGVTFDLRSGALEEGHTRFIGVWGQTRRPVEGGISPISGLPVTGTYGQYLYGTRWEYGGPWFLMGWNNVAVNDDLSSIKNASAPATFNYVDTVDMRLGIPPIYLKIFGEGGVSYFANGTSLLALSYGSAYRAGLDWNVLPWGTHASFDFKDLGGNFGSLQFMPGGFSTAANPGLIDDYRGYESSLSQSILDGQYSLGFNYNSWRDNLQSVKTATTTTNFMSILGTIAPSEFPGLSGRPYLNAGYSVNTQKNDADGNTLSAPMVDNMAGSTNVGLGYTQVLGGEKSVSANISWISTQFKDQAKNRLGQDISSMTTALSAFVVAGASSFGASAAFGSSDQPGVITANGTTLSARTGSNLSMSLRWNQRWVPRLFDSYLSYEYGGLTSNNAALSLLPASSSTSGRNTAGVGATITPNDMNKIQISFTYAGVAANSTVGTVSASDSLAQLVSRLEYTFTF